MASFEESAVTAVGDDEGYLVPHLLGDDVVANEYPPIVPEHAETKDQDMVIYDGVYDHGTRLAREIMEQARVHGRVRGGLGGVGLHGGHQRKRDEG